MAAFLLRHYTDRGLRCAYLSRGYGRKTKGYQRVDPQKGNALNFGDEALQIALQFPNLPVAVCENRVNGAEKLIRDHNVDLIVLDDAFQHRRIGRDLDILMMDAGRLPWKDLVLPAGNLREPRWGMKRASLWVVSKLRDETQIPTIDRAFRERPRVYTRPEFSALQAFYPESTPDLSLESLKKRPVLLFSGLGNNAYFFRQVEEMGAIPLATIPFADHHSYTETDLAKILAKFDAEKAKKDNFTAPILITTEKDFCRLAQDRYKALLKGKPLYYLRMDLRWLAGREQFEQRLNSILNHND